jgi:uncharacterized protein YggE
MKRKLLLAGLVLAPLTFIAAVCGNETTRIENTGNEQMNGISVSGEGKVSAPPDLAMITLGVSTLRPTVAEARDAAATALDAMITSMKDNGIEEKDIQTTGLSIYPEYRYSNNGEQTLTGFRVSNTVIAKLREVDRTGEVVDEAVTAGGNEATIQGISFTIDDPESLREQARAAAVADAKRRAETLASASGVTIGSPISIIEGSVSSPPIPYAADRAAASEGAQGVPETPIEPGELDVIINVTVTWSIE